MEHFETWARMVGLTDSDFYMPELNYDVYKPDFLNQITIKFYTIDSKVFTKSYPHFYTIAHVTKTLSDILSVPYEVIKLLYQDNSLPGEQTLGEFHLGKYASLEFKIVSKDPNYEIDLDKAYDNVSIVHDIITVKVPTENEGIKEIVVEIDNRCIAKPALGGFRHAITGIHYFNGYSQTGPPTPKVPSNMKHHRDTQTYSTRNRQTEKEYERATQMTSTDTWIPNVNDKILESGPYETADEREKRLDVEGKVRTIQRYFRAWKTRKLILQTHEEYWLRVRLEREREATEKYEDEERKRRDLARKVFPMTTSDFAMLYSMVERWKKSEIQRIAKFHCGAAKVTEFSLLLDKEIDLLQSIEKIRQKVRTDLEIKKIVDFFKAIGKPIEWDSNYKGMHIQMDTIETQKGREFFALYKTISDKNQTREERIETLLDLKSKIINHNCSEKVVLCTLIDRATELLARGFEKKHLAMLDKRIEALLMHHFQLTECNEGVTSHMTKMLAQRMERHLIFCRRCETLKTAEHFVVNARTKKLWACKQCIWLDKVAEPWIDLSPYKFILAQIRKHERLHHAESSIAFILQDRDIHHLITDIWHGHSALSECNDIYQLRLCRWRKDEEWSPWNCILLTVEEAKSHRRVATLEDVYEVEFFNHIFNKHALARTHFHRLKDLDKYFTHTARSNIKLEEAYWVKEPSAHCLKD